MVEVRLWFVVDSIGLSGVCMAGFHAKVDKIACFSDLFN